MEASYETVVRTDVEAFLESIHSFIQSTFHADLNYDFSVYFNSGPNEKIDPGLEKCLDTTPLKRMGDFLLEQSRHKHWPTHNVTDSLDWDPHCRPHGTIHFGGGAGAGLSVFCGRTEILYVGMGGGGGGEVSHNRKNKRWHHGGGSHAVRQKNKSSPGNATRSIRCSRAKLHVEGGGGGGFNIERKRNGAIDKGFGFKFEMNGQGSIQEPDPSYFWELMVANPMMLRKIPEPIWHVALPILSVSVVSMFLLSITFKTRHRKRSDYQPL